MNLFWLPWVEIAVFAPLLGAIAVRFLRVIETQWTVALTATGISLMAGILAWVALLNDFPQPEYGLFNWLIGRPLLQVDRLSGLLVPLVALLHFLTIVTSARVKMNRVSFTGHLIGESLRLATFACIEPWPLVTLLALSTLPPYLELLSRKKPTRVYVIHMALFIGLLVCGLAGTNTVWGPVALLMAVLIRSGTVPGHLWVVDLFQNSTFGTGLLYATPIVGVYVALRLVLPVAPEWVLQSIGIASQITAVYAAGLATIQTDARRFFAYLFISQASLVLIGLELHTSTSLSGALGLWVSASLSLCGLGLTLRSLEARHGRLSMKTYMGLYDQTPTLAVSFLLMGLGCVGFPGTLGFVAMEVLVDGAIEANLSVGIAMVLVAALNGIAIVRVYLLLLTGAKPRSAIPLPVTSRERFAVLVLSVLILGGGLAPQVLLSDRKAAAEEVYPEALHQHAEPHSPVD